MLAATSPDAWTTISIIASVVSIALAIFAIWQATTFYRWSAKASKDSERAADAVGASVVKLEDLFNRLYSDTFGMMRDTVSDMRKHVWPSQERGEKRGERKPPEQDALEEIERRASDNVARLREEVQRELRDLVETVGATSSQVSTLESSLGSVLDRAINGSREAEDDARAETIRSRLMGAIRRHRNRGRSEVDADTLLGPLFAEFDEPEPIHQVMFDLRDDGVVDFEGPRPWIEGPNTPITLIARNLREPESG